MKMHIVMHEPFEAPAAIVTWAEKNNCPVSYTKLFAGDQLPDTCNDFDYLIVMGGPQSPATTTTEFPYFNAPKESALIAEAIRKNKFVLGVCLGAQLIGEALNSKFEHSPNREIGVFDLTLTESGKKDPVFSIFPETFPVGHWHGDMPGITPESEILAYSAGCPRQVVRYTPRVYGFQCHFEFTPEAIEGMIKNCAGELKQYKSLPYIQNAETLRKNNYAPVNAKLFAFLDYMKRMFESA
jgi:GMP synthase (glutamine-hydrolysing)